MKNHRTWAAKLFYGALLTALGLLLNVGNAKASWNDRQQLRSEIEQFHGYIQTHPRVFYGPAEQSAVGLQQKILVQS